MLLSGNLLNSVFILTASFVHQLKHFSQKAEIFGWFQKLSFPSMTSDPANAESAAKKLLHVLAG